MDVDNRVEVVMSMAMGVVVKVEVVKEMGEVVGFEVHQLEHLVDRWEVVFEVVVEKETVVVVFEEVV